MAKLHFHSDFFSYFGISHLKSVEFQASAVRYCYMDNKIFEMIKAVPLIEILFVFLPYYIRPLWPTTRIRTALENAKNKSDKNRPFDSYG